jgi:hypothetical protein
MALTYGALGLLLGVLVKGDLEGFFLIVMAGLMDTFLQNPLGNPLANNQILEWFPSFGPMQFAVGGAFGHQALWGHLVLGLAWATAFAASGLVIFQNTHPHPPAPRLVALTGLPTRAPRQAPGVRPRPPRTPGTPRSLVHAELVGARREAGQAPRGAA